MKCLTREEIIDIIEEAFTKGELWGCYYSTFFEPTKEDSKEQIDRVTEEILKRIGEV